MRDTTSSIEEIYREKLKSKSGEERASMGFSMFDTARSLVRANFTALSPADLRVALFNRFYGLEFDAQTREKIIQSLSRR